MLGARQPGERRPSMRVWLSPCQCPAGEARMGLPGKGQRFPPAVRLQKGCPMTKRPPMSRYNPESMCGKTSTNHQVQPNHTRNRWFAEEEGAARLYAQHLKKAFLQTPPRPLVRRLPTVRGPLGAKPLKLRLTNFVTVFGFKLTKATVT